MQKVKIRMRYIFFSFVVFICLCFAEDWSQCMKNQIVIINDDPKGDVKLVCTESETVKKLKVLLAKSVLAKRITLAKFEVKMKINILFCCKTVLVDAIDSNDQVIGFVQTKLNKVFTQMIVLR